MDVIRNDGITATAGRPTGPEWVGGVPPDPDGEYYWSADRPYDFS